MCIRDSPIAAYALAEIFTSDEVRPAVIPDLKMAAEYYEIASQRGYGPASVQLALFKLHSIADPGLGIEKDLKGGMELLQKSARKNLPSAHHYLGRCYFKGIGVEADNDMALVHFQAAADRGKPLSQLLVADFYAYGVSGPVKLDLAISPRRYHHSKQRIFTNQQCGPHGTFSPFAGIASSATISIFWYRTITFRI